MLEQLKIIAKELVDLENARDTKREELMTTIKTVKDVPSVTGVFEIINNRTVLVGYIKPS